MNFRELIDEVSQDTKVPAADVRKVAVAMFKRFARLINEQQNFFSPLSHSRPSPPQQSQQQEISLRLLNASSPAWRYARNLGLPKKTEVSQLLNIFSPRQGRFKVCHRPLALATCMGVARWYRFLLVPDTASAATDLDLISFLQAIPDARMPRGVRIPAWYL